MEEHSFNYDGWEVVGKIGAGSFSTVYEIQRSILGEIEKAALKVISIPKNDSEIDELHRSGYDDNSITEHFQDSLKTIIKEYMFMYEMKGYSNIVYCDDIKYVQKDSGFGWDIFIRMELLEPMMDRFLGPYDEKEIIRLGIDMAKALSVCHAHKVVHRDIKPQNIFYSKSGEYKLGDFGVAKVMEQTSGGTIIGTVNFMAPEVYNNQPYGNTADIYSLGMLLYSLMNEKRLPFLPLPPNVPKYSDMETARDKRFRGYPIPDPVHGSEKLIKIVLKALEYNKDNRYQSGEEMLQDFYQLVKETGNEDFFTRVNTGKIIPDGDKTAKMERQSGSVETVLLKEEVPSADSTTVLQDERTVLDGRNHQKRINLKLIIPAVLAVILLLCYLPLFLKKPAAQPSNTPDSSVSEAESMYPHDYIFYWVQDTNGEYVLHDYEQPEKSENNTFSINDASFYDRYRNEHFKFNRLEVEEEHNVINVYYDRYQYTLRFYFAREYTSDGITYIQVNNNNGSFSSYEGEDIETALTRFSQSDNDYEGGVRGGSVWRTVDAKSWEDLIESEYRDRVGSEVFHGATYRFDGWKDNPAEKLDHVDFTYYYYEINAVYGQDLLDIWPVRSMFKTVDRSEYNHKGDTGDTFTAISWGTRYNTGYFNRLHSGNSDHAVSNNYNINGAYGLLDETLFTEKEAESDGGMTCFLAYWGSGTINRYVYQAYYSLTGNESSYTDTVEKDGIVYKLEKTIYPLETTIGIDSIEALPFEGAKYVENSKETDDASASFYYLRNEHTIHFLSNAEASDRLTDGNSHNISIVSDAEHVKYGEKITMYEPDEYVIGQTTLIRNDGSKYVFKGWYKTPSWETSDKPYDFASSSETLGDEDMTFFARWDKY